MKEITIGKNDAGQRLDRFLAKAVPLLPASLAQKYIRLKRIINRLYIPYIIYGRIPSFLSLHLFRSFYCPPHKRPRSKDCHIRTFKYKFTSSCLQLFVFRGPPIDTFSVSSRVSYYIRSCFREHRTIHHVLQFEFILRSSDDSSRNTSVCRHVIATVMRGAIFTHKSTTVKAENYRKLLKSDIVQNLVVSALGE